MLLPQFISRSLTHILIAGCAVLLAQLCWQVVISQLSFTPAESINTKAALNSHTLVSLDSSEIIRANLFGVVKKNAPNAVLPKPKISRLNIQVLGIISGSHQSKAAILSHNGKHGAFLIHQTLLSLGKPEISITAIDERRITIDNDGTEEHLFLKETSENSFLSNIQVDVSDVAEPPANTLIPIQHINLQDNDQLQRVVKHIDRIVATRPDFYKRFVSFSQVAASSNNVSGLLIKPGKDKRFLAQIPLQSGDIITHLNGKDISQHSQDNILSLLTETPMIALQLQRESTAITLKLSI
ncbi:type II secretion system protein N [Aliamphritea ceti]|uniref:type II secretion system protein N n=1 Tax=Aliamphritea ceti TaxID=1524258 RepID=UPI0021C3F828|nr:type II secretion system protein N [Aliamphritea ceti]